MPNQKIVIKNNKNKKLLQPLKITNVHFLQKVITIK